MSHINRTLVRAIVPASLLALALGGCASGTTTGASQDATRSGEATAEIQWSQLAGRTFTSTEVSRAASASPASPAAAGIAAGDNLELSFTQDGIAASAGCNRMVGGAHIASGNVLALDGALASTMMACSDDIASTEAWWGQFLSADPVLTLTGPALRLVAEGEAGGTVAMTESGAGTSGAATTLEGTTWKLESIADGSAVSSVPAGVESTLQIQDGTAQLKLACNSGSAPVTIDSKSGTLKFGDGMSTTMACVDPSATDASAAAESESQIMKVEDTVRTTLFGNQVSYAITGDELALSDGKTTLTYRAS